MKLTVNLPEQALGHLHLETSLLCRFQQPKLLLNLLVSKQKDASMRASKEFLTLTKSFRGFSFAFIPTASCGVFSRIDFYNLERIFLSAGNNYSIS